MDPDMTDANKTFLIKWKVLKKFKSDNNINKKCNLCLHEKLISVEKILAAWTNAMNYQVQTPTEIDMYSKPLEKRKVTVCIMARELYHATSIIARQTLVLNHQFERFHKSMPSFRYVLKTSCIT